MPRMKQNELSTDDLTVGQDVPLDIPTDGDVVRDMSGHDSEIEVVNLTANLDAVSFFNEIVTVVVHESTDQNAEPIPQVTVNGRNQFFLRGQPIKVRRKYVAALARAKRTSFRQSIRTDELSGGVVQRMTPSTGLVYPFSVIDDPNPRGREWLQGVLAEA
jgi:hypothetical protein